MEYYMGVDVGSTSTKGIVMNSDEEVVAKYSILHDLPIHDGQSEIWSEKFFMEAISVINELIQRGNIYPGNIKAISFSGFESVSFVGREGKEVRPAITYLDSRSEAIVPEFTRKIDRNEIFRRTKNRASSIFEGYKAIYALRNFENDLKEIKLLDVSKYIIFKLTGKAVMDHTTGMLFAPFYNQEKGDWDSEMIEIANFHHDMFPLLGESYSVAGNITHEASERYGLSEDTVITFGAQDAYASLISDGVLDSGDSSFIYATSGVYDVVHDGQRFSDQFANTRHIFPGSYVAEAAMYNAGSLLNWFGMITGKKLKTLDTKVKNKRRPGKIISIPFFTGERAPIWNNRLKGGFLDVDFSADLYDFYLALMEGTGYWLNYTLDKLGQIGIYPKRVVAGGGGSKSNIWTQIVSDIIAKKQEIMVSEGAAQGNAYMAMATMKGINELRALKEKVRMRKIVTPNESLSEAYDEKYRRFVQILENGLSLIY